MKLHGGRGSGWVGLKLWIPPPPSYNYEISWVGLLPPLSSLLTGASSGCLLVPLWASSLCRRHAKVSLWLWGIQWILWTGHKGAPEE